MGLESWSTLGKAMDTLTFCSLVMHPKVYVDNFLDVAKDFFSLFKEDKEVDHITYRTCVRGRCIYNHSDSGYTSIFRFYGPS